MTGTFETIRRRFFPRWDKARQWRCRVNRRMAGDGLCCHATKTIYINATAENRDAVLIHEICHALTPRINHGSPWRRRMLKAATKAERVGDTVLANFLTAEVARYRDDAETVTARTIYLEIAQAVEESSALPSFRSVAQMVARRNAMNVRQFTKRFRGARATYHRTVAAL